MQRLLESIRKASLPAIWSQGVKLARENAPARVSAKKSEPTFRVPSAGHAIAPTVTLYVEDGEWSCDCGGKVDPCAHVVAAVIAATQGGQGAGAVSGATGGRGNGAAASKAPRPPPAKLLYRLAKKDRLLTLSRFIVQSDGREERLLGSLASEIGRASPALAGVSPTHDDLRIDRI